MCMTKLTDPSRRFYLRELRLALGLTQEDVAAAAGATKGQISQLETGHTRYNEDWVERLCCALQVEPIALFIRPGDVGGALFGRLLAAWPKIPLQRQNDLINLAESFGDAAETAESEGRKP